MTAAAASRGRDAVRTDTLRVLLVNDYWPGAAGGAEVHVGRLAAGLEAAGHRVELFAGDAGHAGWRRALDVWDPAAARSLRRGAARFRPDVVHVHNFQRELSASVIAAVDAPTVLTVHDHRLLGRFEGRDGVAPGLLDRAKLAKAALERAVCRRRVDAVIAVSAELAGALRGAGFGEVHVVGPLAATAAATAPGDDVVALGRLSPEKGLDALIRAFAAIAPRHPSARLRIAGDGPSRGELEALAASIAPGRVAFEGFLDQPGVAALLAGARAVCVPSARRTEGAPLAAVEALLAGRPVVATRSPAFEELVTDGVDGFLVDIGDTAALGAALDRLLADPSLAACMGAAAREAAAPVHAVGPAIERITGVYDIARARRAAR